MPYGLGKRVLGLGLALMMAAGTGLALAAGPVSHMEVLEVIKKDGQESFKPAKTVIPGETLEYRITYSNHGPSAFTGLMVNGPVPVGTLYVNGSAASTTAHALRYSVDGGHVWQESPRKTITGLDGKPTQVPAQPEDYTNVQWVVKEPLNPGTSQTYIYRVVVKP